MYIVYFNKMHNLSSHPLFIYLYILNEINSWSPPAFNPNQIRVILCQDTGDKAKLTLYDSAYMITSNSSDDRERSTSELSSSWSGVGFLSGNLLTKSSSA